MPEFTGKDAILQAAATLAGNVTAAQWLWKGANGPGGPDAKQAVDNLKEVLAEMAKAGLIPANLTP